MIRRQAMNLTTPAVAELWQQYQQSRCPEIRGRLAVIYRPLVRRHAFRIFMKLPEGVELDDLIGVGTVALMNAIAKYDPRKGKAESYLITRICGDIIDALRDLDLLPRNRRQKIKREEKARAAMVMELGRPPSDEELAERLGTTPELAGTYADPASRPVFSLTHEIHDHDADADDVQSDVLEQIRESDPLETLARTERHPTLLDKLTDTERAIVVGMFYEGRTSRQVAESQGISDSRVCQIRSNALDKIHGGRTYREMREMLVA